MNPAGSNDHQDSTEKPNTFPGDICLEIDSGDGNSLAASLLNLTASNLNISSDADRNPSPPPPYTTLPRTLNDSNFDPNDSSNVYARLQEWWTSTTGANGASGNNVNAPQTILMILLLLFTLSHRFEETRYNLQKKIRRLTFFVTTLSIVFIIYGISSLVYLHLLG
ncbi:protein E31A [Elephant endotheliotropic herpesvirus 2]|nr:protein E31A [Elephant endotheliotropic herpesvirus 2]